MDSRDQAILKTLLYSDLFNYPLTKDELYDFLPQKITRTEFLQALRSSRLPIDSDQALIFSKGSKGIVKIRQMRELVSMPKLKKAEQIIAKLGFIPTIKFIGISGSLAMKNSDANDDIDIFVISEAGLTWTTRFLTAFLLIILGIYRNKNSKNVKDKMCLNLILSENEMLFKNQDLFTAHEIAQLLPIFDKDKTYHKLVVANKWINEFFPNFQFKNKSLFNKQTSSINKVVILFCKILCLEKLLRTAQLFYMRKAITKEKLEKGFIGLHPFDYRLYVLKKYSAKLSKFGLK